MHSYSSSTMRTAVHRDRGGTAGRSRPARCARALCVCACALALGFPVPAALAEPTAVDKAAAEALFEEGRRLVLAGDYDGACEKFEASQRLDAGIGTLLYLADAYEKAGRTASAWATFREATDTARAVGQPEREAIARGRAEALEPKLSRLTIAVADGVRIPGLKVTRDKAAVKPEVLGVPVPTDPGDYLVEASAPGKERWSARITVPIVPDTLTLTIPGLSAVPAPTKRGEAEALRPTPDAAPGTGTTQRVLGLVTIGLGVAGLGAGGVLLASALGKDAEADERCEGSRCRDVTGVDLSQEARRSADMAGVAFGAGGALLVGGVILFFTAPSGKAPSSALRVTPLLGPTAGGISLGGLL
jgi:hypothetical protein